MNIVLSMTIFIYISFRYAFNKNIFPTLKLILYEYSIYILALKNDKYKYLKFYIKNIGKADINQLDICATAQKNTMFCDI